jgi:hypothetical protein
MRGRGDWTREELFEPQDKWGGLNKVEFDQLSRYNGERAHGIVHTEKWQADMAVLQLRFNRAEREIYDREVEELKRAVIARPRRRFWTGWRNGW